MKDEVLFAIQELVCVQGYKLTINGIDFYNVDYMTCNNDCICGYAENGNVATFEVKREDVESIKITLGRW